MLRGFAERKCNLKMVEIPITVRYDISGTLAKNPVLTSMIIPVRNEEKIFKYMKNIP